MQLPKSTDQSESTHNLFNTSNNTNPQGLFNSFPQEFKTLQTPQQSHLKPRQLVPKELGTFSGQLEDRPIFYSTYEWPTAPCVFSNSKNLIRIRKSFQGDAYHSVQHVIVLCKCTCASSSDFARIFNPLGRLYLVIRTKMFILE